MHGKSHEAATKTATQSGGVSNCEYRRALMLTVLCKPEAWIHTLRTVNSKYSWSKKRYPHVTISWPPETIIELPSSF
jgi:hypothetical protein